MASPLKGKTLYAFGSSIVNGHLANVSFVEDLATDYQLNVQKFAVNGATTRTADSNNILAQINQAPKTVPDFIIFDSWANDAYPEIANDPQKFGQMTADFTSPLDTLTYCGGLEKICRELLTKYQGAKIILLATHKTPARDLQVQNKLYVAAMKICLKWSIDVIDLYGAGSFNAFLPTYQHDYSYDQVDVNGSNQAFGGSGTHPNATGYRLFYDPLIANKLLSLA